MEYTEAIAIRVRSLHGQQVDPQQLAEAMEVIRTTVTPTRRSRTKGNRPRKQPALRSERAE